MGGPEEAGWRDRTQELSLAWSAAVTLLMRCPPLSSKFFSITVDIPYCLILVSSVTNHYYFIYLIPPILLALTIGNDNIFVFVLLSFLLI